MTRYVDAEPFWAVFRDSLWGKGLEFLKLSKRETRKLASKWDKDPLRGVTPSTHPIVRLPETMPDLWNFDNFHILVRPEYNEAERAAISTSLGGVTACQVSGQSGIGVIPLSSNTPMPS